MQTKSNIKLFFFKEFIYLCAVKRINFINDEIINQIIKAQDEKMENNKQSTKPVPKKNKNGMVVDLGKSDI